MEPARRSSSNCRMSRFLSHGILMSLMSGLMYSLAGILVKCLRNYSAGQLTVYRYLGVISFNMPPLVFSQRQIFGSPGYRIMLMIFSFVSALTIYLNFMAFQYLPLGEATTLISCYPAFVTVSGRIFLKESFGLLEITSLLAMITGILLVTGFYQAVIQKSMAYTTENIYGIVAAIVSLLTDATGFTIAGKLRNSHWAVLVFVTTISGIIFCVILTSLTGGFILHKRGMEQALIILLGAVGYAAYVLLVVAVQNAPIGPVSIARCSSDIIFSFLWQALIFDDVPNGTSIVGALVTCVSISIIAFRQKINALLPPQCITAC